MMEDHDVISAARNHLLDALKALMKAELMGAPDFLLARNEAQMAMNAINRLLQMAFLR